MRRAFWYHLGAVAILGLSGWLTTREVMDVPAGVLGTRFFGYGALTLLALALMVGPLARLAPGVFRWLVPARRALGVWSAVAAGIHFLFVLQMLEFHGVDKLRDVYLRPVPISQSIVYVASDPGPLYSDWTRAVNWTGTGAAAILIFLALTSSDTVERWLGAQAWKHLQRQVYTAAALVTCHFGLMWAQRLKGSPPKLAYGWWLLAAAFLLQFAGVARTVLTYRRHQARSPAPTASRPPQPPAGDGTSRPSSRTDPPAASGPTRPPAGIGT
ncbi:MAG: ferric reductase-like transmembrane domain-containing protein [Firmicutes bacterium]|nr:ferric reductase-like transmembrane domain-containing protein [Bacillota bacterium]